ncbi:hypothetical protein BDV59DRAFT_76100 [Aspergillus ambiguus]|uniref:uncharacterized protein n=1 Tax=Aspergillus ambiguus TaxID=176160 RepID=UPI003CCE2D34
MLTILGVLLLFISVEHYLWSHPPLYSSCCPSSSISSSGDRSMVYRMTGYCAGSRWISFFFLDIMQQGCTCELFSPMFLSLFFIFFICSWRPYPIAFLSGLNLC